MEYLLATYVDGVYWRSALEVMLYPTGCSFYRPFSYRKDWASVDVTATPVNGPLGTGVLGMRFRDEAKNGTRNLFIPLRRIDSICIREHHEFHVEFRLGPYVHHSEDHQFKSIDLSAKLGETLNQRPDLLLAKVSGQFATELENLPTRASLPPDVWDRFIFDSNLAKKAAANLANATILQLLRVRRRDSGVEVTPEPLETVSSGVHARSGYRLRVGKVYNVDLVHRTLTAPGATPALQRIAFDCLTSMERVRVSRLSIPQTGNYREERIWIQPRTAEPAPTEVEWEPRDQSKPENVLASPESAIPLRVPFMAVPLPWYEFQRGRLSVGVSFTLLAAVSFASAVITASSFNSNWSAVWVAIGAVCAPIGASAFAGWWDRREAQKE